MNERLWRLAAILLLSAVCAGVSAQTCRNDIAPTAPDSRFTGHGDGTISDSATGLLWKQCAEGLSGAGCAIGVAAAFIWQAALQQATDANFAGYMDWRLPNKNELESLVERHCYDPEINGAYFPNTPSDGFWSSSPYAGYTSSAWYVSFVDGGVGSYNRGYPLYVRLVRGE
ncbi:DUF1566 domain-containing protein [uncultured Thiodictyon sp.]|uniref:Lcl C-terminal domain-containing protein n=1 Tax=uncultured Thiodictyon sp. TaxID=1846217 RepID=UPI0025E535C4|nr:DUF1566 domain-containing protein [uncultured Thiodictyon sp.]